MCVGNKIVKSERESCSVVSDPMDCSPLGSSVHGIIQARILEWVAVLSSRGLFRPRDRTHITYVSCLRRVPYHKHYLGSPKYCIDSITSVPTETYLEQQSLKGKGKKNK